MVASTSQFFYIKHCKKHIAYFNIIFQEIKSYFLKIQAELLWCIFAHLKSDSLLLKISNNAQAADDFVGPKWFQDQCWALLYKIASSRLA